MLAAVATRKIGKAGLNQRNLNLFLCYPKKMAGSKLNEITFIYYKTVQCVDDFLRHAFKTYQLLLKNYIKSIGNQME